MKTSLRLLPVFLAFNILLEAGAACAAPKQTKPAPAKTETAGPAPTPGWVLNLTQGSGEVAFDAIGKPAGLKIHATGEAPKGELKVIAGKLSGVSTFKLDSLDTGIGLRTEHMKKRYLETEKHPEAKLTLKDIELPSNYASADFSKEGLPFKGILNVHGVDQPVEGIAKLARAGEAMEVDAKFEIKTSDFKIATPSFAGVTMAETVKVSVKSKAPFRTM